MKHKYKYIPPETGPPLLVIQHGGECGLTLEVMISLEVGFEIHHHRRCVAALTASRHAEMQNSSSMINPDIYWSAILTDDSLTDSRVMLTNRKFHSDCLSFLAKLWQRVGNVDTK